MTSHGTRWGDLKAQLGSTKVAAMTQPPVLVNTYLKPSEKPYIDNVSKIFIYIELLLGIVRLPLLGNVHFVATLLSIVYSVAGSLYIMSIFYVMELDLLNVVAILFFVQCLFYNVFNLVSIKRLQRYYNELNVFDKEVGCRPKIGKGTIRNIIQTIVMFIYITPMFVLPLYNYNVESLQNTLIPFTIAHILEVHFLGHFLSLLIPRLRLINYYMELSLSNSKITKTPNVEEFGNLKAHSNKALCKMDKLMNLYHNMIRAYNFLIEAVKWQLLVTIITSFINILICCYKVSMSIIKDDVQLSFYIMYVGFSIGIMLPLFAPCMLGDQVHNEVRRLRELIASRLYENQLDKASRGMARALLAWTETRDLSFSLLRMLDIDISLPFKFVGLLVTYLIILLQFQKVINP